MRKLNRLPTRVETAAGALVSLFLSVSIGWILWYTIGAVASHRLPLSLFVLVVFVALALVFAWSSALFLRIALGQPRLPSFKAQRSLAWLMVLGGCLVIGASFVPVLEVPRLQALLHGLAGLSIGFSWAYQARAPRAKA
jgi:divalent metal cation (Fe/Co/Zn/Cd) transporter